MSGARSRRKGARWEREVATKLEDATGVECVRCLTEPRDGNVGDITTALPITVQAKVGQRPNLWSALAEAVEAAPADSLPVAILRRNGSGGRPPVDVAAVPLGWFLRLLERLYPPGRGWDDRGKNEVPHSHHDAPGASDGE